MKTASVFAILFFGCVLSIGFAEEPKPEVSPAAAQASMADQVPAPQEPEAASSAALASPPSDEPAVEKKKEICFRCPAEKLGRGISNVFFSILECPLRIGKEMEVADPIAGFSSGIVKGIFWTAARLTAGVFDIATFFLPTEPIIQEFDAGWWSA